MNYIIYTLKKPFDFDGRARRIEYWLFYLFYFVIYLALFIVSAKLDILRYKTTYILPSLFGILVYFPMLSVTIRRLHDVNKSGWFMFVPVYGFILLFLDGTSGRNDYDVDPKNENYYQDTY